MDIMIAQNSDESIAHGCERVYSRCSLHGGSNNLFFDPLFIHKLLLLLKVANFRRFQRETFIGFTVL